jgi:DNA-binding CsgD family transcriptional regulator
MICLGNFRFSVATNSVFKKGKAYLNKVDNLSKKNQFYTENILLETEIDSTGHFVFTGDFLPEENHVYKIYINNCEEAITHPDHLLNQCTDNISYLFIANNQDSFLFPLNNLNQMFCSTEGFKKQTILKRIDDFREDVLMEISEAKNDGQRKLVYQGYVNKLQLFCDSLPWPMAQLYGHYLLADEKSFSFEYFKNQPNLADHYDRLFHSLEKKHQQTLYYQLLKKDAKKLTSSKKPTSSYWSYILLTMLVLSLSLNGLVIYKYLESKKRNNRKTVSLSIQEDKVYNLILEGSTNKEIAQTLFISLSTVKTHINNIYKKMGVSNRQELKDASKK